MQFAVIGNPIAHSLSPQIHQDFAKQSAIKLSYTTILGQKTRFEHQIYEFFLNGGQGLNVTAPFKERAYALADVLTPRCQEAKAANTLWMKQGLLHADNTDGIGFIRDISKYRPLAGQSILLLGAGGAARGIIAPVLAKNPRTICISNRSLEKAAILLQDFPRLQLINFSELHSAFDIVINATSAEEFHLPKKIFHPQTLFYDLRYHKDQSTAFVNFARRQGCEAVDGLGMLVEQAAEAFKIWHGVELDGIVNPKYFDIFSRQ